MSVQLVTPPDGDQPGPMSDAAAELALDYLRNTGKKAGQAKARVVYMERWVKVVEAMCIKRALDRGVKSIAQAKVEALIDPEYLEAVDGESQAITDYEEFYWKRIAAEATIEAWRTKNANHRSQGKMQ